MPFLNSHTVSLFAENQAFVALILSSLNIFAGQIDFYQNKNSAAKASLTSHSYYSTFTIGVANFSPELRLPLQMFYDPGLKDEGLRCRRATDSGRR